MPALPHMPEVWSRLLQAAVVTLLFTAVARRWRAVTPGGAAAGAAVAFVLYASGGPSMFAVLVAVFLITIGCTRFGHARKQRLALAESRHGRTAAQILANLSVAAVCSGLDLLLISFYAVPEHGEVKYFVPLARLAAVAALAEAAGDSAASEIGTAASSRAVLITNFRSVAAGTDGGISVPGTAAAVAAAFAVSCVAAFAGVIPMTYIAAASGAAILGVFADSVLGATVQRRGWLNNNGVNLFGTLSAAVISQLFLL